MLLQHLFNTIVSFVLLTTSSGWARPCISIGYFEHCYNIVDANITWNDASRICKEYYGHLITIETAEEHQFIAGQVQKRNFTALALWIGLKSVRAEDGRTWVNLEKVSYENWAIGEPNTPPGDENCAEISTSNFKWNDRSCTCQRGYICEKTVFDGTSYLVVFGISVATVSALVLHVSVLYLCCLMNKRLCIMRRCQAENDKKKNQKEKKVEVYQVLQEMEMRNAEHVYNEHIVLSGTCCTIDDYSSRPDDLTQRKERYNN